MRNVIFLHGNKKKILCESERQKRSKEELNTFFEIVFRECLFYRPPTLDILFSIHESIHFVCLLSSTLDILFSIHTNQFEIDFSKHSQMKMPIDFRLKRALQASNAKHTTSFSTITHTRAQKKSAYRRDIQRSIDANVAKVHAHFVADYKFHVGQTENIGHGATARWTQRRVQPSAARRNRRRRHEQHCNGARQRERCRAARCRLLLRVEHKAHHVVWILDPTR